MSVASFQFNEIKKVSRRMACSFFFLFIFAGIVYPQPRNSSKPFFDLDTCIIAPIPTKIISYPFQYYQHYFDEQSKSLFVVIGLRSKEHTFDLVEVDQMGRAENRSWKYPKNIHMDPRVTVKSICANKAGIEICTSTDVLLFTNRGKFISHKSRDEGRWDYRAYGPNESVYEFFCFDYHELDSKEKCGMRILNNEGKTTRSSFPNLQYPVLTSYDLNRLSASNESYIVRAAPEQPVVYLYNWSLEILDSLLIPRELWTSFRDFYQEKADSMELRIRSDFIGGFDQMNTDDVSKNTSIQFINEEEILLTYHKSDGCIGELVLEVNNDRLKLSEWRDLHHRDLLADYIVNADKSIAKADLECFDQVKRGYIHNNRLYHSRIGMSDLYWNHSINEVKVLQNKVKKPNVVYLNIYIFTLH